MQFNAQVKFSTGEYSWLCFNHAVSEAIKGVKVEVEIDDFDSEYYMGATTCVLCMEEREAGRLGSK